MRAVLAVLIASGCTNERDLGNTPPALGPTRWAITVGGPGSDEGRAVAIDGDGNVFAGGALGGRSPAAWISKRAAADGAELWTHLLPASVSLAALASTPEGGLIAAGTLDDAADFGGVSLAGRRSDSFLVAYDRDGHAVWATGLSRNSLASIQSLAVAANGQIFVSGACDLDPSTHQPGSIVVAEFTIPCTDTFLAAFAPDGTLSWFRSYPNVGAPYSGDRMPLFIAADAKIFAVATLLQPVTLDGIDVAPNAQFSILLAELSSGGLVSARTLGDGSVARDVLQVAAMRDGFVTVGLNGMAMENEIVAWDEDGAPRWVAPQDDDLALSALAVTHGGAVVNAGATWVGAHQLGPMFVMAHSANGRLVQLSSYSEGIGHAFPGAVATGPDGELAFVGNASGRPDVGTGPLPNAGSDDLLVGVIDPFGAP
jgi:hypothetical protein